MRLKGKKALISGGGSGIGQATALLFAREGAAVTIAGRDKDKLAATASLLKGAGGYCHTVTGDISTEADCSRIAELACRIMGGIDILFNNAGIYCLGNVSDTDEATWDSIFDINLKGCQLMSKAVMPGMKKGAVIRFYDDGVKWLRARGIVTVGSFIVGFPGETEETVEQTRRFIETSGLDYYFIQPFYYLHHTPIHKRAAEHGLKGNGLLWTHDTMNWRQAINHINRLFLEIEGPVFVNPDYTLWEIAYLRSKGLSLAEIRDYRVMINRMTRDQMAELGVVSANTTSRPLRATTGR